MEEVSTSLLGLVLGKLLVVKHMTPMGKLTMDLKKTMQEFQQVLLSQLLAKMNVPENSQLV